MNLPFLKLRVADCPWIVFDRSSEAPGDELPWGPIAVDICSRSRGASAVGVIVLGRRDGRPEARTWDSAGEPRDPPPAALLCASRLLFDAGRAGPDSVSLRIPSGEAEVMVIDSRILGLSVGFPSREDGSSLGEAAGALGRGFSAPAGLCVAMPVRLGAETLEVVLFDSPPARKSVRRTASRVDALAVSRQELRVRRGTRDPLVAAAAALAAAVEADYADREASVIV
ncbi:MAG: hypothetical protein KKA67_11450, partial [Spirochaetes bacterium]|nr:hypothetical protein [Spirochaetota bacterium]